VASSGGFAAKRRQQLAERLAEEGSIAVGAEARRHGVSTETIRKDLLHLEQRGLAQKSHGGAVASSVLLERSIAVKRTENVPEKAAVAGAALELLPERGVILLDAGTTTLALAHRMALLSGLTVFTNSVEVMTVLAASDNEVYALGGRIRSSSQATVGQWAVDAVRSIRVDLAFLGTDGIASSTGPSCDSFEESQLKSAVVESSGRVVVLADSMKFATEGVFRFCDWAQVHALVTNTGAPKDEVRRIGRATRLVVAPLE
jgi:DeoR family transcriptional regulator of aga operon